MANKKQTGCFEKESNICAFRNNDYVLTYIKQKFLLYALNKSQYSPISTSQKCVFSFDETNLNKINIINADLKNIGKVRLQPVQVAVYYLPVWIKIVNLRMLYDKL